MIFDFSKIKQAVVGEKVVVVLSIAMALVATWYSYAHGIIVAYGDAESHLNIAKRVVDSVTPGMAQLGGIWLPLPHILMLPFVKIDFLWRTGLAGSIVSGTAFVIASLYIYKTTKLITLSQSASFIASLIFILNPNILYLQSTPMTELTLIVFFVLSSYYFIRFIKGERGFLDLVMSAFFGFCATLSRYDGWFLVGAEAAILIFLYLPYGDLPKSLLEFKNKWTSKRFEKMQGLVVMFSSMAFIGIVMWLLWGWLILGDPLYFTHSQFSAKSQQSSWLAKGQLPAYKHLLTSFSYYFVTSLSNIGIIVFGLALLGLFLYVFYKPSKEKFLITGLLSAAFIFYVVTLYIGQSVIFIRPLTPTSFDWTLFNVRYGVMMVPIAAIFFAFLYSRSRYFLKVVLVLLILVQTGFFLSGKSSVVSMEDGIIGLSAAKRPDAENWLKDNYTGGMVLMDDYARTVSVVRSGIPMQDMIYVGNKPYWQDSLEAPQQNVEWIVMEKEDTVWQNFIDDQSKESLLYTYFQKVYTSPNILIFKRNALALNASN